MSDDEIKEFCFKKSGLLVFSLSLFGKVIVLLKYFVFFVRVRLMIYISEGYLRKKYRVVFVEDDGLFFRLLLNFEKM